MAAELVGRWFAAHEAGDLTTARELLAADARISVPGAELQGFDGLMQWYADRRAGDPDLGYDLLDLLTGEHHVAAVLRMHSGPRSWRQYAVYEVADGQIIGIRAFETEGER